MFVRTSAMPVPTRRWRCQSSLLPFWRTVPKGEALPLPLPACRQGVYARLRRASQRIGVRGYFHRLRLAETPPHPSPPRKRGEEEIVAARDHYLAKVKRRTPPSPTCAQPSKPPTRRGLASSIPPRSLSLRPSRSKRWEAGRNFLSPYWQPLRRLCRHRNGAHASSPGARGARRR